MFVQVASCIIAATMDETRTAGSSSSAEPATGSSLTAHMVDWSNIAFEVSGHRSACRRGCGRVAGGTAGAGTGAFSMQLTS